MPRSVTREITTHKVNGCNDALRVTVHDEPGCGGACHHYQITGYDPDTNPSDTDHAFEALPNGVVVLFQNGPIKEVGTNGVTHETLLAILEDRLAGFQAGPYACAENAEALDHIRAAQSILKRRTEARLARGVEGTHKV